MLKSCISFSFLFIFIFIFLGAFFYDTLLNDDDYDDASVLSVRYLSVCLSVSIIKSSYLDATSSDHTYPREMPDPLPGTRNLVMMMMMMMLNHNNNKTAPPWYRRHLES